MKKEWIEWIYYADNDIASAKIQMAAHGSTGHVAVFCQQAIEKYFKAHLIEHGWELRKTHNLLYLYDEIENIQSWNLDKNLLADVNDVYLDNRYPGDVGIMPDGMMPSEERTRRYLELAQEVEIVFKKLHINKVDDIKEIIQRNYSLTLTSKNINSINETVNNGKLEYYQAYNKVIEEIRNVRHRFHWDENNNYTQRDDKETGKGDFLLSRNTDGIRVYLILNDDGSERKLLIDDLNQSLDAVKKNTESYVINKSISEELKNI
jgi:HEPN domain-containing protein